MSLKTSASATVHAIPMTTQPVVCPAPVLTADFDRCSVPGGLELWQNGGYYSPGVCFIGYVALCTQTAEKATLGGWPISKDETAVRCVPVGYECNDKTADQRYGISLYNQITLSAPAFEIRWRSEDVNGEFTHPPAVPTSMSESATSRSTWQAESSSLSALPAPSGAKGRTTSDMSAGKIAGIVIGAGLALCAVLSAVFIMHFRRTKVSTRVPLVSKGRGSHDDAAELDPGATPIAELQSERPVKELDSNRPKQYDDYAAVNQDPAELPGDSIVRPLS